MNKDFTGVSSNDADNLVYLYPTKKDKAGSEPVVVTFKKSKRYDQDPLVRNFVLRQSAGQSLPDPGLQPKVRVMTRTLSMVRNKDSLK